jgi:hypothetical protein
VSFLDRLLRRGPNAAEVVGSPEFANALVNMVTDALDKAQSLDPKKGKPPEQLGHDIHPWDMHVNAGDEATLGTAHLGTAGLDYETLAAMSRVPTIAAIIQTRVNQIAEFSWPATEEGALGFQIRLRDRDKTPTRAEAHS